MEIANKIAELAHPYLSGRGGVEFFMVNTTSDECKILLFLPYSPYLTNPAGHTNLDAYYVASNELYHVQKKIVAKLADYNARVCSDDIKSQFISAGCGIRLHTSLIAIPPYGTKVALGIVKLDGNFVEYKVDFEQCCDNCGRCIAACPSGGLTANGFVRENCLRDAMDNYQTTAVDIAPLCGSILGCSRCQSICPHNAAIACVKAPQELITLLSFESLSQMFKIGKRGLMALAPYMGANYIRPKRLAYFAINSVLRKEDCYFLEQFFDYGDKFIADFAIERYSKLIR